MLSPSKCRSLIRVSLHAVRSPREQSLLASLALTARPVEGDVAVHEGRLGQ